MKRLLFPSVIFMSIFFFSCQTKAKQDKIDGKGSAGYDAYLLVGTYTSGSSKGIYVYNFNTETGASEVIGEQPVANPSYLTINGKGNRVYAVSESGENSYANAFGFDARTGKLHSVNKQATKGADPCYIVLSPDEKQIITANYTGGSLTAFPVDANGALKLASQVIPFEGKSIVAGRQDESHLHCALFSPDGKYLFATDLGTDCIYRFDTNPDDPKQYINEKSVKRFPLANGSGPRHIIMHPSRRYLYLINELGGTVMAFDYNDGELSHIQTTRADDLQVQGSADIAITPDGKFLYASNRLQGDGVAVFAIHTEDGSLSRKGYQPTGSHPRNIAVTPNGNFLLVACRDTNRIEIYAIDKQTGSLQLTPQHIPVDKPVCLVFASK